MATSEKSPYESGWGLIGGHPDRRGSGWHPAYEHPMILRPEDSPEDLKNAQAFFSEGRVEVEIGFRRAHFLKVRTKGCPDTRFLGFELGTEWCRRMARYIERESLRNTRIIQNDARFWLRHILPTSGVHVIYVFFPDPWWKKKHHKRRLITAETLDVFFDLLAPCGALIFRSDVAPYFEHVLDLIAQHGGFDVSVPEPAELDLPKTHREKKCAEMGIDTLSLRAMKRPA